MLVPCVRRPSMTPVDAECLAARNYPKICWFEKGRHADRVVMLIGDEHEADRVAQCISIEKQ